MYFQRQHVSVWKRVQQCRSVQRRRPAPVGSAQGGGRTDAAALHLLPREREPQVDHIVRGLADGESVYLARERFIDLCFGLSRS